MLVTSGSLHIWFYPNTEYKSQEAELHILLSSLLWENTCTYTGRNTHKHTHTHTHWQIQPGTKFSRNRDCVFGLHTHKKRMIPVLDIAKANPRIPLPIMALLRLKMDMPNEVFPSNCKKRTAEDVTRTQINSSTASIVLYLILLQQLDQTCTFSNKHMAEHEHSHL